MHKFALLLLSPVFFLYACNATLVDDDEAEDVTFTISDQNAQGSIGEDMPFETETALVDNRELFDDPGYYFQLFDTETDCDETNLPPVGFFIETSEVLTPGEYNAEGPFITSSSFFGAEVIITEVTDNFIVGKVKGGDPAGDKNIEGAFQATLCE